MVSVLHVGFSVKMRVCGYRRYRTVACENARSERIAERREMRACFCL